MGNLWETGEVRNHRQVTIAAVQLHFLDDVVITTMVEISGDESLQVALCLNAGVDARCEEFHCYSISDKSLAVGGGAMEAITAWKYQVEKDKQFC